MLNRLSILLTLFLAGCQIDPSAIISDTISDTGTSNITVTSISPAWGSNLGGATVKITGTGFLEGVSATLGDSVCDLPVYISPTEMTCTTGAHDTGSATVTVFNSDGTSGTSLRSIYSYKTAPTVTSINPATGNSLGGTTVTITGTGFQYGITATLGGFPCTSPNYRSATQMTCIAGIRQTGGIVKVRVFNLDGISGTSAASIFSYLTLSSVLPTSGPVVGATLVTIVGTGFQTGMTASIGGVPCTSPISLSPTQMTCIPGNHETGEVTVTVTDSNNISSTSSSAIFTYLPTVDSIAPTSGPIGGGTRVTITGAGFLSGMSAKLGTVTCTPIGTPTATQMICTTGPNSLGGVAVTVRNSNGTTGISATSSFTYIPSVTSVSPPTGSTLGGTSVTITGAGFQTGISATLDNLLCTNPQLLSPTQMTCTTAAHLSAAVTATVTNPNGLSGSLTPAFTYQPTFISVSRNNGSTAGGTLVTITGTGFLPGVTATLGSNCATSARVSETEMTCLTASNGAGAVSLTTTNPNGTTVTSSTPVFTYVSPPTVTSTSPQAGSTAGGTSVTILGTGFLTGINATIGGVACTSVTGLISTQFTCTTGNRATGDVSVTVTNSDGLTGTSSGSIFSYDNAPIVSGISPAVGGIAGGTNVTITGSGFLNGAITATVGGVPCTSPVYGSSEHMTCTTGAHAVGKVTVQVTNANGVGGISPTAIYGYGPTINSITPAVGSTSGGQTVTIAGTGFNVTNGSTSAVQIGNVNCSSPSSTAIQITCTTGSINTAGSFRVAVTNSDGVTGISSGSLFFAYENPPIVTSITPVSGGIAGGTNVTINGSRFQNGAITAKVGGVPCTSPLYGSSEHMTCTTGANSVGRVTVQVTNANGVGGISPTAIYGYGPTINSITPAVGSTSGGQTVTIAGTGFAIEVGSTSAVQIGTVNCSSPSGTATQITCTTGANNGRGNYQVSVTNADGVKRTSSILYLYETPPGITTIEPDFSPVGGGTVVTITGTGFIGNPVLPNVNIGGASCSGPAVTSSTKITCTTGPSVSESSGVFPVSVTILNTVTNTRSSIFRYKPTITNISPNFGNTLGGTTVTLTGTGFAAGMTAKLDNVTCTPTGTPTSTQMTCVTGPHAAGVVSPEVTANSVANTGTPPNFTYQLMTIDNISPTSGPAGTLVTITGQGFRRTLNGLESNVNDVKIGAVACSGITVVGPTQLSCTVGARSSGAASVTLTDNLMITATSASEIYTYTPSVVSILPISGTTLGGVDVTITGTGFNTGLTAKLGTVDCQTSTWLTLTTMRCTTPVKTTGPVTATVTNSNTTTATSSGPIYTYIPYVTSVTPANGGGIAGGTLITINGSGFNDGIKAYLNGQECINPIRPSAIQMTCTTPAQAAGSVPVSILNLDASSASLNAGFTYRTPPVVTLINPTIGLTAGGTLVTITGNLFTSPSTVSFGGIACTDVIRNSISELQCKTGTKAAGPVTVTVTDSFGISGTSSTQIFTYSQGSVAFYTAGVSGDTLSGTLFGGFWDLVANSQKTIFVADTDSHTIRSIAGSISDFYANVFAGILNTLGSNDEFPATNAKFSGPSGVATDTSDAVYIADTANHTIRKILNNASTHVAGVTGIAGAVNGQVGLHDPKFNQPRGIAVDSIGDIYVADSGNNTIRKITSGGLVTTLAGTAGVSGFADGTGAAARFDDIWDLTIDFNGNLLIADSGSNTIRKITQASLASGTAGVVTTLAGSAGYAGGTDGTGTNARFYNPRGLTSDKLGNIYVADYSNFIVRKVTSAGVVTTVAGADGQRGFVGGTLPSILDYVRSVLVVDNYLYVGIEGSTSPYYSIVKVGPIY